jgi:ribosomal protein S18 acetylase RimI-like enzyme
VTDHDLTVVTLGPDDWPLWRTLRLEALQAEPAAFSSTYAESLAQPDTYWRQRLGDERRLHFMARVGDRAVGMVGCHLGSDEGDPRLAGVFGMYVSRSYRRLGVGHLLLHTLIERVSELPELAIIKLWVGESQHPARRLYESAGFQIVGLEPGPQGDELIMELRVERAGSGG